MRKRIYTSRSRLPQERMVTVRRDVRLIARMSRKLVSASLRVLRVQLGVVLVLLAGCLATENPHPRALAGEHEIVAMAPMITIPAGPFIMGSDAEEREYGYSLDEKLHNSTTARQYRWFERETRHRVTLAAYRIDRFLVSNAAYQQFVVNTGHRVPFVTETVWRSYRLIHEYATVREFLWQSTQPPPGRAQHPVVLVSHADAQAYCAWRGHREGRMLRLPTEEEWEKAARGTDGRYFPWGNAFDPDRLNSYDRGPFDTVPVGRYKHGRSPYGVLDMAGQVFEWTATLLKTQPPTYIVKGGSWDDLPGVTRSAARHGRPADLKHVLIGFRCAGAVED